MVSRAVAECLGHPARATRKGGRASRHLPFLGQRRRRLHHRADDPCEWWQRVLLRFFRARPLRPFGMSDMIVDACGAMGVMKVVILSRVPQRPMSGSVGLVVESARRQD